MSERFVLNPLDWDTAFFGARMGVVSTDADDSGDATRLVAGDVRALDRVIEEARGQGYRHLIFRVPAEDTDTAQAAEEAGFRLVDVGVDSTYFFTGSLQTVGSEALVRSAREDDLPFLQNLSAQAFSISRFAADPFFSFDQVAAFYREWISNLYRGLAQAVLICEVDGNRAGFVSCAMTGDQGRIPLIATDAVQRRRGIGRSLVQAALRWFSEAGAAAAHVKTQAANYPALALYHRSGFVVTRAELTFSISPNR